jgi:DNA-binding response OmpR family regulator
MKVVLVEDNQTMQQSIAKVLIDKGHYVKVFSDGESARKWLMVEHATVDVCIFDYMLPLLDGMSLTLLLRSAHITIPVLMLTARDTIRDKVAGLENGADYYLTKPFEFEELLACLKVLHRRPRTYQVAEVEVAPEIMCNLSNHTLVVAGKETPLTLTEFSILEYLIMHRSAPVSQHELYEHVFDFAKENWSNTIEVHVKNLRKKLQIKNHENPIKTIRGVGYTL